MWPSSVAARVQGTWTGVLEGQDPIRYLIAACGDGSSAIAFVRAAVQQEGVIPQILLQRWAIVGREQSCASLYALSWLQACTHHRQKASSCAAG